MENIEETPIPKGQGILQQIQSVVTYKTFTAEEYDDLMSRVEFDAVRINMQPEFAPITPDAIRFSGVEYAKMLLGGKFIEGVMFRDKIEKFKKILKQKRK